MRVFSQKSLEAYDITIKLLTRMFLPNLQKKTMVAKLSQRWLNSGVISVDKGFTTHLKYWIYKKKIPTDIKKEMKESELNF